MLSFFPIDVLDEFLRDFLPTLVSLLSEVQTHNIYKSIDKGHPCLTERLIAILGASCPLTITCEVILL